MRKLLTLALAIGCAVTASCSSRKPSGTANEALSIPTAQEVKSLRRISLREALSVVPKDEVLFINASTDGTTYFRKTVKFHPDRLIPELEKQKFAAIVTYCSCPGDYSAAAIAVSLRKRGYSRTFALQGGAEALQAGRAQGLI